MVDVNHISNIKKFWLAKKRGRHVQIPAPDRAGSGVANMNDESYTPCQQVGGT